MANFVISGDTSGTVTLQAPAVSGTTTLTLPVASGTILTTAASQTLTTPNVVGPLTLTSGGITFNANPGGGTQATLNDYEVGSWTPNLVASAGSITAQTTSGSYIKVGKLVTVCINITSITVGASTTLYINNLPFTTSTLQSQGLARENKATGLFWNFNSDVSSTNAFLFRYDNSNAVASTLGWNGSLTYISAA